MSVYLITAGDRTCDRNYMKISTANDEKKTNLVCGLKDVQRQLRKGAKGLVVFAGDVSPIDIMCHMPAVCEGKDIPYCYIPSQRDLALAVGFTNSCLMVLIKENNDYKEVYDEVCQEVKKLNCML